MPKITVAESAAGAERSVDQPQGGSLQDISDEHRLPIPFSCRSASCATCHVEVVEGGELLEAAQDEELMVLDIVGGPEGSRLACQVQVKPGAGAVKVRPL